MTRGRFSFGGAALWIVPLIAAALFAVAGFLSYLWLQRSIHDSVRETLQTILRADVEAMTFWLDMQSTGLNATAHQPAVVAASDALMALGDADATALRQAPAAARFASEIDRFTRSLHLDGYALIDPNGRILASSIASLTGSHTVEDARLIARAVRGETVLAPPRRSAHDHQPYLAMLTAVPCALRHACGVLRFRLRPDGEFTRILNVARFGRTGETYAFDDEGRFVSESRFVDTLAQIGLVPAGVTSAILGVEIRDPGGDMTRGHRPSGPSSSWPFTRMAADAITGHSGLDLDGYRDYRGVPVVGAWTWLSGYGIGLATEVDLQEAYRSATIMRRALYLPFGLLIGASIVAFLMSAQTRALRTTLVATEGQVEQRDAVIRSVFNTMSDGIMVAGPDGQMLFTNPAIVSLTGIGQSNEPPEHWVEQYGVFLPDMKTPFPTQHLPLIKALRGEAADDVLMYLRNPKKPEGIFLSVSGRPLRDAADAVIGSAIVARDVTAEREAEEAIRTLNLELERNNVELSSLNQELEAFSYSVSHDLRAPLRHIHGFVDLLQKRVGASLDDTARRHLSIVADAARRMGALIDDLLAFSRMSRTDMHRTAVDLDALVGETIVEVVRDAEQREITWDVAPLPVVQADRAMVRIALMNLLSNAVKYTRRQPHARIEVGTIANGPHDAGPHDAGLREDGPREDGFVTLRVRDNGVGFEMQYTDKLFGVFQRLHRADEFEGTGIGLATVRRIVHRHGGRIWAEAALDAGATFFLSLPLAEASGGDGDGHGDGQSDRDGDAGTLG